MDETLENYTLHLNQSTWPMGSTYLGQTPSGSPIKLNFRKKSSDAYRAELFLNGNLVISKSNILADDAHIATELLEDAGILDLIASEYEQLLNTFMGWLDDIEPAQFV